MACQDDSSCGSGGGCCRHQEMDSLGPEAVEIANLFEQVNGHLTSALSLRRQILETLHQKIGESPEMKEKMDKLIGSMHPVLVQFIFGQ